MTVRQKTRRRIGGNYATILLRTLAIGFAGAGAAVYAGLPAAPLVGASICVSIAALFRLTVEIPPLIRNCAFAVIGCSLGSGMTREALAQAVHWPISLMVLGVMVATIMIVSSLTLHRVFAIDAETAVLSTAPGTFAYTLAMAVAGQADARAVLVIQNIRLVLVTTLLPFILAHLGFAQGRLETPVTGGYAASLATIAIAIAVGIGVRRWRIPASFLLAGIIVSGVGHYLDLVVGRPPLPLLFVGFAITGTMAGARFSAIPGADLRRLLGASLVSVLIAGLLSIGFAYPIAVLFGLPLGQVFVAFAPGGVEAMAAIAISMGYDPAYVATHHLFRLVLLFSLVPLSIRLVRRLARRS